MIKLTPYSRWGIEISEEELMEFIVESKLTIEFRNKAIENLEEEVRKILNETYWIP